MTIINKHEHAGKIRWGYYVISVLLILVYLLILWRGMHPTVSDEYRLYYIEKELIDWPGDGGLMYTLGDELLFGVEIEQPSKSVGHGWSAREERGIWTIGGEAVLYLDLSDVALEARTDILTLHMELAQWFTEQVEVIVNGKSIGIIALSLDACSYELPLPVELVERGMSSIMFRVEHSTHENGVGIKLQKLYITENQPVEGI